MQTVGKIDKSGLGERQQMIMLCVWDIGGSVTIREIIDQMEIKYEVRFSTSSINKLVLTLVDKGYLASGSKRQRACTFYPLITRNAYLADEMRRLIRSTFHNSPSVLLDALLRNGISAEEHAEIRELLNNYNESV